MNRVAVRRLRQRRATHLGRPGLALAVDGFSHYVSIKGP